MKWKMKRADMERILIVCAAALVVALALKGGGNTVTETLYEEPPLTVTQTSAETSAPAVETQSTVCYYQDGDGYLVPVTRQVEKQDGIAKATLALMVQSSQNDMDAARMGLRTIIPEGTSFDIDISGGKARVDMSKEALNCASMEDELLMIQGTAAALCCFDTVQEVEFLFDGQKRSKLTHGTDVSGTFDAECVNVEAVTTMATGSSEYASQVQLYFPSQTGRMLVPVTRTVFSTADLTTALLELAKGPRSDSGLERPLPEDCGIRSVTVKDGVATIDFSKSFLDITNNSDGGKQAVRAVLFTASQFPGVQKVHFTVEGQDFQPPEETTETFLNDAQEVMTQYPGVVEID